MSSFERYSSYQNERRFKGYIEMKFGWTFIFCLAVIGSLSTGCAPHLGDEETAWSEKNSSLGCADARAYFESCTGYPADNIAFQCTTGEAEAIPSSTPCDALQSEVSRAQVAIVDEEQTDERGGQSLLCRWFEVGCPADDSCLEPGSVRMRGRRLCSFLSPLLSPIR